MEWNAVSQESSPGTQSTSLGPMPLMLKGGREQTSANVRNGWKADIGQMSLMGGKRTLGVYHL
jgi:hypothetical protein